MRPESIFEIRRDEGIAGVKCVGVAEIELSGAEVAIFEAEIDVGADRGANARDQLPCPGAVAFAKGLDPGAAETAADAKADAVVIAEVKQGIAH